MLVHERAVVRIDPEMPLAPAALLGCGATTGLGAVFNTANVRPGETVAVIGCGGVGLCMVQAARIAGASRIIAIDPVRQRRELAYTLGATDTLDPSARDVHEDVMHLTGLGVDHALEAVGTPDSVSCALSLTCPGGSCTVAGAVMGHQLSIDGGLLLYARRLQGSILGSSNFRLDIPRYVDMYLAGQLRLDELITSRRSLAQVSEAFEDSARHVGIRALITFD
jgi:S-(hydroxymethyl)glutathione dehydrogenase/alcohol dehydrogenase